MKVVVIGGGAAGFFGAIVCAEMAARRGVILLEKEDQVLAKVRISGGGRCNVTHACYQPDLLIENYPRGGKALLGPFHSFQPRDTVEWFESRGVRLKTEEDGRLFPCTDRSATIVDALKQAAGAAGVEVRTRAAPVSMTRTADSRLQITLDGGERIDCGRLLLATGSGRQGLKWAASFGHTIEPPVPSLFTFVIRDERLGRLAGISVANAEVQLVGTPLRQRGPLLITHRGLSGPAVLRLSAWGARVLHDLDYRASLQINWVGQNSAEIEKELRKFKTVHPKKTVAAATPFSLPHRLWERLVFSSGLSADHRWGDLSSLQARRLTEALSAGIYEVRGKNAFKEEFVTCGGVRLDEVDFRTMQSRLCPGLYFAGEILDIDGLTGGFNFQSAWTTGWIAGRSMAGDHRTV